MKLFRSQPRHRSTPTVGRGPAAVAGSIRLRPRRKRLTVALSIIAIGVIGASVVAYNFPISTQLFAAAGSTASQRAVPPPASSTPGVIHKAQTKPSDVGTPSVSATPAAIAPSVLPTAPLRVLAIGDSIMKGFGVEPSQAWPELISQQDGWSLTALACNGAGFLAIGAANDCNSNFPSIVKGASAQQPDLVIIEGSSNDFGMSNSALLESTVSAASDLQAEFPRSKIVGLSAVWGDTTVPDEIAEINSQVQQAMTQVGGTYVDVGQPLSGHPELMQGDDVHPTAAGQQVLAAAVKEALISAAQAATDTAATQAALATAPGQP